MSKWLSIYAVARPLIYSFFLYSLYHMRAYPLLLIFLAAFACTEISYREPQPKGRKALMKMPVKLQGRYVLPPENQSTPPDTVIVTEAGYTVTGDSSAKGTLSDSLLLKYYKGYYFLNMHEKPEWLLRVLKPEENGDLACLSMEADEKSFNAFVSSLSGVVTVDSLEVNGKKLYQIDPTPKQLMRLVTEGYFNRKILLKRVRQ
jgi:hypothetical protein